ncbi:MAG: hypothetical protein ACE15D_14370 [Candidatus Eisenbacteria bacterium]|nr:hypothetical protein [Candidatus Eisenbacteria bacterium]
MTAVEKRALVLSISLILVVGIPAAAFGIWAYRAGTVRIDVREAGRHGSRVHLIVPGFLVPTALAVLPDEAVAAPARTSGRDWLPIAQTAWEQISEREDFELLRVTSPREHVTIAKKGRSLHIHVLSADDTVRVEVPVRLVRAVLERIARAKVEVRAEAA